MRGNYMRALLRTLETDYASFERDNGQNNFSRFEQSRLKALYGADFKLQRRNCELHLRGMFDPNVIGPSLAYLASEETGELHVFLDDALIYARDAQAYEHDSPTYFRAAMLLPKGTKAAQYMGSDSLDALLRSSVCVLGYSKGEVEVVDLSPKSKTSNLGGFTTLRPFVTNLINARCESADKPELTDLSVMEAAIRHIGLASVSEQRCLAKSHLITYRGSSK